MTSSSNISGDVRQGSRLRKVNTRYFSFKWKSESSESTSDKNNDNTRTMDNSNDCKKSNNGFFRNIKKKLSVKQFYKFKRRITTADSSRALDDDSEAANEIPSEDKNNSDISERISSSESTSVHQQIVDNNYLLSEVASGPSTQTNASQSTAGDTDNLQNRRTSQVAIGSVGLSKELLKLQKFGWYWGPIQRDLAEEKLVYEPDGAFLIRDSHDPRYLLTLSFKSAGKTLHSRIEHRDGKFSLCNNGNNGSHQSMSNESFTSIADLIQHSMGFSEHGVFCYSRPRYPGHPAFPVRLTKPVSRLTQVRSLQDLCRFVIRRHTRLDNIDKLPLPNKIKEFLEGNYV